MPRHPVLRAATYAYWAAFCAALFFFAWRTTIGYYDGFEFLRNARALAGTPVGFSAYRPPLIPLLHAPLQVLLDACGAGMEARLRVPHLLHALLTLACLRFFYGEAKRLAGAGWAQAATVLFSLDRILIHYSFFAMSDVASAAAVLLVLRYGLTPGKGAKGWWAAAGSWTALLLSRWNMLALWAAYGAYAAVAGGKERGRRLGAAAAGGALFVALSCAVLIRVFGGGPAQALPFLGKMLLAGAGGQFLPEGWDAAVSRWDYARFLADGAPVAVLLASLGAWRGWKRHEVRFHAAWLAVFLLVMSLGIAHKEARFLLPALPAVYLLAVIGWESAARRAGRRAPAVVAAALALSGWRGAREWTRFADPAYRSPIVLRTAEAAASALGPGGRLAWSGWAYSIAPGGAPFSPKDPTFYLYHVPNAGAVEYLTGKGVTLFSRAQELREGDVVVSAPGRLAMPGSPLTPGEDRVDVLRYDGRRLVPAAKFP